MRNLFLVWEAVFKNPIIYEEESQIYELLGISVISEYLISPSVLDGMVIWMNKLIYLISLSQVKRRTPWVQEAREHADLVPNLPPVIIITYI